MITLKCEPSYHKLNPQHDNVKIKSCLKEPFNDVAVEYYEKLTAEAKTKVKEICVFESPKSKLLLEELFELITFRLNKTVSVNPEDVMDPESR